MDLKLADLWEECPACGGTGEPQHVMRKLKPGEVYQPHEWTPRSPSCQTCRGMKGKPTAAGKAVFQLLENIKATPVRVESMYGLMRAKPAAAAGK